jgi:large subunit ribosomal protein L3
MTKLWLDNKYVPVTLLVIPEQEVLQWKTEEKDGYVAVVVGTGKKESDKTKGNKVSYAHITEFR